MSNKGPLDLHKTNNHQTSDIPWRRSNVKHTNNEMYVDVIETVNVIIKPTTKKQKDIYNWKSKTKDLTLPFILQHLANR